MKQALQEALQEAFDNGFETGRQAGFADAMRELNEALATMNLGDKSRGDDPETPIREMGFSERIAGRLHMSRVFTLGGLLEKTENDILNMDNLGQKSLDEIRRNLARRGLKLREK